jgi:excisionase family DNA binding protein
MEQHYSPKTAAATLEVPVKTVLYWLQQGQLHGVKVGKKWRIPESSLQAFIQQSTATPGPRVGRPKAQEKEPASRD